MPKAAEPDSERTIIIGIVSAGTLNFDNIDFKREVIHIEYTVERVRIKVDDHYATIVKKYPPKSVNSHREIPIPKPMINLLRKYHIEGAYLLTGDCKKYMEPRNIQRRFNTVLKKCDITIAKFHTTRHSFSTRCVECGVEAKALSEMLGHTNVSFTLQRYYHPSIDTKRDNINLLSDLLPVRDDRQDVSNTDE